MITVNQFRSFTSYEWMKVLSIVPLLSKIINIKIENDCIVCMLSSRWIIHRHINDTYETCIESDEDFDDIYLVRSLFDIYAPDVLEGHPPNFDKQDAIFNAVRTAFGSVGIQYIFLSSRILYTLDDDFILEYTKGDDAEYLIGDIIQYRITHPSE